MTEKKTTSRKSVAKKDERTVTFNQNVKVGDARYRIGETSEVSQETFDALASAGVIKEKGE